VESAHHAQAGFPCSWRHEVAQSVNCALHKLVRRAVAGRIERLAVAHVSGGELVRLPAALSPLLAAGQTSRNRNREDSCRSTA